MPKAIGPYIIQSYKLIIHDAEEGGYWGEILELPGCVSQGETLEELRQNIVEAIDAVLTAQAQEPHGEFYINSSFVAKDFEQSSSCDVPATPNRTWTAAYSYG